MRNVAVWILLSTAIAAAPGCGGDEDGGAPEETAPGAPAKRAKPLIEQVAPPIELKAPPADAVKAASGLVYKKLVERAGQARPKAGEAALVRYTGWRQRTGETFVTTRRREQPIAVDVAHAAPGFGEALRTLGKGERAVIWIPPGAGVAEPLVYEVEVVDIVAVPVAGGVALPAGGAAPPATRRDG